MPPCRKRQGDLVTKDSHLAFRFLTHPWQRSPLPALLARQTRCSLLQQKQRHDPLAKGIAEAIGTTALWTCRISSPLGRSCHCKRRFGHSTGTENGEGSLAASRSGRTGNSGPLRPQGKGGSNDLCGNRALWTGISDRKEIVGHPLENQSGGQCL